MKKILLVLTILLVGCTPKVEPMNSATCTLVSNGSETTVYFEGEEGLLTSYRQTRKISTDSLIEGGYKLDELDTVGKNFEEEYSKYSEFSTFTYKIEGGYYQDELIVNEINLTTAELFDLKYDQISIEDSVDNFITCGYTCTTSRDQAE